VRVMTCFFSRRPPGPTLFPYTTLFRSHPNVVKSCPAVIASCGAAQHDKSHCFVATGVKGDQAEERERWHVRLPTRTAGAGYPYRSEEHTSELQSLRHLVCRLLLEKKKT